MMNIANEPAKRFTQEKAIKYAAILNADEDEANITYAAIHDPKGTGDSLIGVYDNGELIAKL